MDITLQLDSQQCQKYATELHKMFAERLHSKSKQCADISNASVEFIQLLTIRNWALQAFGYQVTDDGVNIEPYQVVEIDAQNQSLRSLANEATQGNAESAKQYLAIMAKNMRLEDL